MFRKTECEEENCFDLAEFRDKWRAIVIREIDFGCYKMEGGGGEFLNKLRVHHFIMKYYAPLTI